MQTQSLQGHGGGQCRVRPGNDDGECVLERGRGATAEIQSAQEWKLTEECGKNTFIQVVLQVLLSEKLAQSSSEIEAGFERVRGDHLELRVHALRPSESDGAEVREIQALDDSAKGRISRDMLEKLGEDERMGNGDVTVQRGQGSGMKSSGGQETGDEVGVPVRVVIGRNVGCEQR